MSDRISLEVNGKRVEHFISYTVDADLYVAGAAFSMEFKQRDLDISGGMLCRLYVNDQIEMTGVIDRVLQHTDKTGSRITIDGRDLMGLVVDSYCEDFRTVEGMRLSDLAQLLLRKIPFINRKQILYQQDLVGKLKSRRSRQAGFGLQALFGAGEAERIAQIRPGMTAFQVLSTYALSRGQMFFGLPDGSFAFGRPRTGGEPEFSITVTREGLGNNFLSAEVAQDISRRYSKVTVVPQRQAQPEDGHDVDKSFLSGVPGSVTDDSFPFYKPYVQLSSNDSQTPKQHARLLLEKMRHDGLQLTYDLPRHSQNGKNFTVNRICHVKDTVHRINGRTIEGSFLISGRTFRLDKNNGPTTTVRLSPPGLVEDGGARR